MYSSSSFSASRTSSSFRNDCVAANATFGRHDPVMHGDRGLASFPDAVHELLRLGEVRGSETLQEVLRALPHHPAVIQELHHVLLRHAGNAKRGLCADDLRLHGIAVGRGPSGKQEGHGVVVEPEECGQVVPVPVLPRTRGARSSRPAANTVVASAPSIHRARSMSCTDMSMNWPPEVGANRMAPSMADSGSTE